MWNKKDWVCLGVSAAAAFGVTFFGLYPSNATAELPMPAAFVIQTPVLNIDGVSITASTGKDDSSGGVANSITFVKPGLPPKIELRAFNNTDREKAVRFADRLLASRIPNPGSRVAMPAGRPSSRSMEEFTLDLKPGESRVIPISTDLTLAPRSSVTLRLESGTEKVDALAMSSGPQAVPQPASDTDEPNLVPAR